MKRQLAQLGIIHHGSKRLQTETVTLIYDKAGTSRQTPLSFPALMAGEKPQRTHTALMAGEKPQRTYTALMAGEKPKRTHTTLMAGEKPQRTDTALTPGEKPQRTDIGDRRC